MKLVIPIEKLFLEIGGVQLTNGVGALPRRVTHEIR